MSIENKLREILNDFGNKIASQSSWMSLGGEFENDTDYIAQIKEAFADAGYDYETDIMSGKLMSGQEWLERFEKELGKSSTLTISPNEQPTVVYSAITVTEAAKKASGLK